MLRRHQPLGLALLGLALAAPAVTQAGWPASKSRHHNHLCPKCQMARALAESGGAPVVIEGAGPGGMPAAALTPPPATGGCAACQAAAAAHGGALVPEAPAYRVVGDEAPGYASVGGEAPGYASVGATSTEPAPIGVVQAGYNTGGSALPMPMAPPARLGDPSMMAQGGLPKGELPPGMTFEPRPSLVARIFGLGRIREARLERARDAHAAMRFGADGAPVNELPAAAVYGR